MEACSHDECLFGKGTKRHLDGMTAGTLYALDIPDAVEMDEEGVEDGPKEMSVEEWASAEPSETEDGEDIEALPELDEEEDSDGD